MIEYIVKVEDVFKKKPVVYVGKHGLSTEVRAFAAVYPDLLMAHQIRRAVAQVAGPRALVEVEAL